MSNYRYRGDSLFLPNKCRYDEIFHAPGDTVDEKLNNYADCMKRESRISFAISVVVLLVLTIIISLVLHYGNADTSSKIYFGIGASIIWILTIAGQLLANRGIDANIAEIRNSYNEELKSKLDLTFEEFHKSWFARKRQDDYMDGNVRRRGYSSYSNNSGPRYNISLPAINFSKKK